MKGVPTDRNEGERQGGRRQIVEAAVGPGRAAIAVEPGD